MAKRERPDPIADYVEWTQHRYDPGYYLGGNLPPHLRKGSLGPRARRRAGALLGVMAAIAFVSSLPFLQDASTWERIGYVAIVLLVTAAAVRMFRLGRGRPTGSGDNAE